MGDLEQTSIVSLHTSPFWGLVNFYIFQTTLKDNMSPMKVSSGSISYTKIIFPGDLEKVTTEIDLASRDRDTGTVSGMNLMEL